MVVVELRDWIRRRRNRSGPARRRESSLASNQKADDPGPGHSGRDCGGKGELGEEVQDGQGEDEEEEREEDRLEMTGWNEPWQG